jgi:hypothetical protein
MKEKKNKAFLEYQGRSFSVWQDEKDYWWYSLGALSDINTQNKELQTALNIAHESIRDSMPRKKSNQPPKNSKNWPR